jgi:hypothetical protein
MGPDPKPRGVDPSRAGVMKNGPEGSLTKMLIPAVLAVRVRVPISPLVEKNRVAFRGF